MIEPTGERLSRLLEVWVDGSVQGTCSVPVWSIAARAVLKYMSGRAELRDPENHEVYRYDPGRDSLFLVVG